MDWMFTLHGAFVVGLVAGAAIAGLLAWVMLDGIDPNPFDDEPWV